MSSSDVKLNVLASDGCSELYLVDDQFKTVACAVGELHTDVAPGLYKVRQRIGDTERSQVVEVPEGVRHVEVALPSLPFASPIPLSGTNTSREFQQAVMRRPQPAIAAGQAPRVSLLVRDFRWRHGQSNRGRQAFLRQQMERLGLEAFDGHVHKSWLELSHIDYDAGLFHATIELPPGSYVLTQRGQGGAQHCLPLAVLAHWSPQVFLQIAGKGDSDESMPLDLDHAAIVYAAPGEQLSPENPDLMLLEVARKALARQRAHVGADVLDRVLAGKVRNPLLGLMGAHLLLGSPPCDTRKLRMVIGNTAAMLGDAFPDIVALRLRLADLERNAVDCAALPPVSGPPLLAASWASLAQHPCTTDDVARIFSFPYSVEATSTWFMWTETREGRRLRTRPHPPAFNPVQPVMPAAAASVRVEPSAPVLGRAIAAPTTGSGRAISAPVAEPAASVARAQPVEKASQDDAQTMVEHLLSHDAVQDWVRKLKTAERSGQPPLPGLSPLDRGLLTSVASAQASLIPGVIDARTAAERLVRNLNVPMAAVKLSANRLLNELQSSSLQQGNVPWSPLQAADLQSGELGAAGAAAQE